MKKFSFQRFPALLLVLFLVSSLLLSACSPTMSGKPSETSNAAAESSPEAQSSESAAAETGSSETKAISIGVTNPLLSMNPLITDATEVMKYAVGFAFLPLIEMNDKAEFVPQIAASIENNEDNTEYSLQIDPKALWSDGKPITAEDVAFTLLIMSSESITNPMMSNFAVIKGLENNGTHKDDVKELEGIQVVDEKTLKILCNTPVHPNTMKNGLLRYVQPVPKHVLGEKSAEELKGDPWFNAPTVVSGPYVPTQVDPAHYVSYVANKNYWMGAPKTEKLNLRIYSDGANLLPALKSGEVNFVQPTTGSFPQEDISTLESLDSLSVSYGTPITNQLMFFNCESLPDANIRLAILKAINRPMLVENFLNGHGEVVDGLINNASLFKHQATTPALDYDPEGARNLLEKSGWDKNRTLSLKINSGDRAMTLAADVIAAQLEEVGIRVKVQKEDLNNLLADAGAHDYDLFVVQYTLAPADPYVDVAWLMDGDNWSVFKHEEVPGLLGEANLAVDSNVGAEVYGKLDKILQNEVPIANLYVISSPGVVAKNLKNAQPTAFGAFLNVQDWVIE